MFDILLNDLRSISFHTELLEVCGWDEEICEEVVQKASDVLENLELPDIPCDYRYFIDNVVAERFREENIEEDQIRVIIRIIDFNAEYITKILNLPEN